MSIATPLMSERARAWLASVKDVPPDQLSQHATQAAQTGLISFGDAIALKQMADRISGAAKKDAPSPTSVVQDLKQQIQHPQPVPQINMPTGQEAPQDPRMQAGIATLPAPAMDNIGEAGMADGGIVAFAGAGTVGGSYTEPTQAQIAEAMRDPRYLALLPRVMHQESRGNPNAVSPKGARGKMQVMPHTSINPGFGVTPAKNNSPQEQERVGREYLAAMLIRNKWDVPAALYAYNAGPGAQEKYAAGQRGMPRETRDYIRNVAGNGTPDPWAGVGVLPRGMTTASAPAAPAPAGIPAALPTTGQSAGVGVTPTRRFLADVLRPGAAPVTPEEAAHFDQAFGTNWRTKYQGMTHTTGTDVTGTSASRTPTSIPHTNTPSTGAAPVQAVEATQVPDNAPSLSAIDIDKRMKEQGISKQDRLLMLANAGFKMAQAASQPGAKFLGSAAVGGSEAAQGLAALNADQKTFKRALQDAALKREEAMAALGMKGRELDIQERLGLGKISADTLRASAALSAQNLKAEEFLRSDPEAMKDKQVMEEERENAMKHPNSASATRYNAAKQRYDARYSQIMGNLLLNQQVAQVTGVYPGYSAD